jgi:hypothetical protein
MDADVRRILNVRAAPGGETRRMDGPTQEEDETGERH